MEHNQGQALTPRLPVWNIRFMALSGRSGILGLSLKVNMTPAHRQQPNAFTAQAYALF